ncbi:MAG: nucleotidyltransferase family protein [Legionella sp.]|nr:nucleotidyltransferase family protein [Legionella sp.]
MLNWKALRVRPEASLKKAMEILNQIGLRIVLVVNEKDYLLGTITDGDVRRALLKRCTLDTSVSQVMCKNPQKALSNWTEEQIRSTMEKRKLFQLPIVDDVGRLLDLRSIHDVLNKRRLDNPVFLMAGGFGTRLHPLTKDCPKPLLELAGKPILELILEQCIEYGFHRFFISTHYLSDKIKAHFGDGECWGVNIQYIVEDKPLGTGGALGLLPQDALDAPMLMMNADLLTKLDFRNLLSFHQEQQVGATICVREYEHRLPYGVVEVEGHQVIKMTEKPAYQAFINAGIYLLSPEFIKSISPGVPIDMPDVIQRYIDEGNGVNIFPIHEYWLDIGRMDDFKQAETEIKLFE